MARARPAPLSLSEVREPPRLQTWVDECISDGIKEAKRKGRLILYSSTTKADLDPALGVFDSLLEDAQFFGSPERVLMGVGAARVASSAASIDMAASLKALSLGTVRPRDASNVIVMGGWGFARARRDPQGPWRDFSRVRWVVPALSVSSEGGERRLTLNLSIGPSTRDRSLRATYRRLLQSLEHRAAGDAVPPLESAESLPSRGRWVSLAERATDAIARGEMKKVVLSRAVELNFQAKVPASAVLRRLLVANPESTVFAIKRKESVFVGAAPESLLAMKSGDVDVDCLAASSPRGADPASDAALSQRLLGDPKSLREHELVVQAAVSALSPIASRVEVPSGPVVKGLASIKHLYTPVRATLFEAGDVWKAAAALWPNPAICGEPREKAFRWIRMHEGLDRGWFSGVVGTFDAKGDQAKLAVGIRSGVIRGSRVTVYAGAGIVAGSDPTSELEETGWKLKTMGAALGIDAARMG